MNFLAMLPQIAQLAGGMGGNVAGAFGQQPQMAGPPMVPPQQMQQPRKPRGIEAGSTWGNIIGLIGDALLARSGLQPQYGPRLMQQREQQARGSAFRNFLGQNNPALAELADVDFDAAMKLYQMQQPESPAAAKEYSWYRGLPKEDQAGFERLLRIKNPGAPLVLGENDSYDPGGGQSGSEIPTVNSPDEARRLPPGTQFRMPDGRIGTVPGGPTARPSGGFPSARP